MTATRSTVDAVTRALRDFYRGARGRPGLVSRLLQPAFDALSLETQLFLAREVTLAMTASCLEAKERWGDVGNVVVDGNEVRVGTGSGESFVVLGHGGTWEEAFADADRREQQEITA